MANSTDTTYEVSIALSSDTVQALSTGGFSLGVLKAIATTMGGGQPVFWIVETQFATSMAIQWIAKYEAYVQVSQGVIVQTVSQPIDYGQMLHVEPNAYNLTSDGFSDGMAILNDTTTQYTCGLSGTAKSGPVAPIAAFPLYGKMIDVFAPIEQILLMFSTYPAQPGDVLARTYAQALLVDMTSAPTRTVSFDINSGWSWGGGPWARTVAPNTLLAPVLIQLAQL